MDYQLTIKDVEIVPAMAGAVKRSVAHFSVEDDRDGSGGWLLTVHDDRAAASDLATMFSTVYREVPSSLAREVQ